MSTIVNPDLVEKRKELDTLLRRVWLVLREISDFHANAETMSVEDLDVWGAVTKHSAIQSRLDSHVPPR